MKKLISILMVMLALVILCIACDPAVPNSKYPIVIMSLSEYRAAWDEIKPYGKSYYTNPPIGWTTELIDSAYREGKLNFASRGVLRISDNCIEVYDGSTYVYIHNLDGIEDAKAAGLKH